MRVQRKSVLNDLANVLKTIFQKYAITTPLHQLPRPEILPDDIVNTKNNSPITGPSSRLLHPTSPAAVSFRRFDYQCFGSFLFLKHFEKRLRKVAIWLVHTSPTYTSHILYNVCVYICLRFGIKFAD